MINVENLKPFPKFCYTIGMIPTSYKESLTYEEQLIWFCSFLQDTVIPTVNNNGQAVQELQNLYIELKNYVDTYFENLDVQEEINNKLDEMAQDGTLQEIITAYLQISGVLAFNTVQDMKEATNLINGSFVQTYGFFEAGDKGASKYKVRTITNDDIIDESTIIELADNYLIAELIKEETMNIKQFGAKEDNISDDTLPFKNALKFCKKLELNNKTYFLDTYISLNDYLNSEETLKTIFVINNDLIIEGNNAKLRLLAQNETSYIFSILEGNAIINNLYIETTANKADASHFQRTGGNVYSNIRAIDFDGANSLIINNINITNLESLVIFNDIIENIVAEKLFVKNCTAKNINIFMFASVCNLINIDNCNISHINSSQYDHTFYLAHDNGNIFITNCKTSGCTGIAFDLSGVSGYDNGFNKAFISNCDISANNGCFRSMYGTAKISNCTLTLASSTTNYNCIQHKGGVLYVENSHITGRHLLFSQLGTQSTPTKPNTYFMNNHISVRTIEAQGGSATNVDGQRYFLNNKFNIPTGDQTYDGLILNENTASRYYIKNNSFDKSSSTEQALIYSVSGVNAEIYRNDCTQGLALYNGEAGHVKAINNICYVEKGENVSGGKFINNTIIT